MKTETQLIVADEDMSLVSVEWQGMSFPISPPFRLFAGCRYAARITDQGRGVAPRIDVRVVDGHARHYARATAE